jgi:multidrug efflux pump subunit AcrA (membrane-fusion protein)
VVKRRLVAGVAVLLVAVGVAVAFAFAGGSPSSAANGSADNAAATSLATVTRQDLSQQTQVSATLGYAGSSVISVPAGTAPANVQQAQQQAASAQAALQSAAATLTTDQQAFAQATATRAADRRKLAVDCSGGNAAQTSGGGGGAGGSGNTSTPCATDSQAASTDEQNATQAQAKVAADRNSLTSAQASLSAAQQSLATAQSSASTVGQTSVYTRLPKVGAVVRRGQVLYAIGGTPVLLLYGGVPPWRAFVSGMSPGADVAELNRNLGLSGDVYTSQTSAAISSLQAAHGLPVTGELLLGGVVFQPGPVRVTSVTPAPGAPVQAGPVVNVTSTRRVVTIALDASQQGGIKVGDSVVITLPDNSTTPGRVSFVGTVATTPSDQGGGNSSGPTIEVDVTPQHPAATGRLDQAPVDVSITTATVRGVLAVPVNALVALAGGGYAVEEVQAAGVHQLVAVSVGLFDDAAGMVQVSGSGLAAGQRVVVPAS